MELRVSNSSLVASSPDSTKTALASLLEISCKK
jgi:hypothetical protein